MHDRARPRIRTRAVHPSDPKLNTLQALAASTPGHSGTPSLWQPPQLLPKKLSTSLFNGPAAKACAPPSMTTSLAPFMREASISDECGGMTLSLPPTSTSVGAWILLSRFILMKETDSGEIE